MRYSNTSNVPLSIAVFLATDNYDYNSDPLTISATSLLKPTRQMILSARLPPDEQAVDLMAQMPNRMGAALHDSIERAWLHNYAVAMEHLGIPKGVINLVKINPDPDTVGPDDIPVYLEQRSSRKVGKWTISGKFDFIGQGRLEDFKSTGVFTYLNQTNNEKYSWQGSIYRWLNPKLVTQDKMAIQFLFTDWQGFKARQDPKYPQARSVQQLFDLKSLVETEQFIKRKLEQLEQYWDADEPDIPHCTDEDLWRSDPSYKYYSDPAKVGGRSTRNFDSLVEATLYKAEKGKGVIIEKPGEVTACKYCPAFSLCSQKDLLIERGDLNLGI